MATTLNTTHSERGIECTLPDGRHVGYIAYHGEGMWEFWSSWEHGASRVCGTFEAVQSYALCIASEFEAWEG